MRKSIEQENLLIGCSGKVQNLSFFLSRTGEVEVGSIISELKKDKPVA